MLLLGGIGTTALILLARAFRDHTALFKDYFEVVRKERSEMLNRIQSGNLAEYKMFGEMPPPPADRLKDGADPYTPPETVGVRESQDKLIRDANDSNS